MYNTPFYIPGYNQAMMAPNLIRGIPAASTLTNTARAASTGGLFQRLGTSLSGLKAINWGGLINNTSKTLGIINQTIPIVRQVGPTVNNLKQMMRVASLFKDETDINNQKNNSTITKNNLPTIPTNQTRNNITNYKQNNNYQSTINVTKNKTNINYDESPTFFISN